MTIPVYICAKMVNGVKEFDEDRFCVSGYKDCEGCTEALLEYLERSNRTIVAGRKSGKAVIFERRSKHD